MFQQEKKKEMTIYTETKLEFRNQMHRVDSYSALIDDLSMEVDNYGAKQKIEENLKEKLSKAEASLSDSKRKIENDQRMLQERKQKLEISEFNCIKLEREVDKVKNKAKKMMGENLSASSAEEDKIKMIRMESEKLKVCFSIVYYYKKRL